MHDADCEAVDQSAGLLHLLRHGIEQLFSCLGLPGQRDSQQWVVFSHSAVAPLHVRCCLPTHLLSPFPALDCRP